MESALRDSVHGPSARVFDRAQAYVYNVMKSQYYPKFRLSKQFRKVRCGKSPPDMQSNGYLLTQPTKKWPACSILGTAFSCRSRVSKV